MSQILNTIIKSPLKYTGNKDIFLKFFIEEIFHKNISVFCYVFAGEDLFEWMQSLIVKLPMDLNTNIVNIQKLLFKGSKTKKNNRKSKKI